MHLDWWTCQGTFPHTLSLTGAPPPVPPPTLVWIGWNQLSRAAGPQRWHYTSMKFPLTFHCCHRVKSQDNQVHFVLRKLTAQSKVCRMALKWDATGCLGCQSYEVIGYKVPGREKGFFFFCCSHATTKLGQISVQCPAQSKAVVCLPLLLCSSNSPRLECRDNSGWIFFFHPLKQPSLVPFYILMATVGLCFTCEGTDNAVLLFFVAITTILLHWLDPPLARP